MTQEPSPAPAQTLSFPEGLTERLGGPLWALMGLSPAPMSPCTEPDNSLSVSIPEPSPLRVLLGSSLTIPCYFIDPMHPVTTAPSTAPLAPRIKWSRISKEKEVVLLVATEGRVRVNSAYQDKVTLPNYPAIPSDATLEIQNLRSNDSGIYRCEVMHGIEDSQVRACPGGPCFTYRKNQNGIRTGGHPGRLACKPRLLLLPVHTSVELLNFSCFLCNVKLVISLSLDSE